MSLMRDQGTPPTARHLQPARGVTGPVPAAGTAFHALEGGHIAYDDHGTGPLVVAVPGLGDLRQSYRFMTPGLVAAGYRVVTMDVRGHGESSPRWPSFSAADVGGDILALIEHLDAGPATVVGTSMAAAAAVCAAATRPTAVASLALIGPFVRDLPVPPVMRALMAVLFAGPWRAAAWARYYRSLYVGARPSDLGTYAARLRATLREPGRFDALAAMMQASKADCEARAADVRAPATVIMGSRDPDFPDPEAEARHVAELLGGAVVMIDGAGHYPHAEAPDATLPALLAAAAAGHRAAS
jgi:pimeloyl-ACP methyl ester carboxylesterase